MIATRTIFIIPGFKHTPTTKAYKELARMLKKDGYRPILVTLPWKQTTISQNTNLFLKKYKKITTRKKYILGFSFGAMVAFIASTKVNSSGLILCSLSPYFKEDLRSVKKSYVSEIMKEDFATLHCKTLAKQVKAKQILMLYGALETRSLKNRVTNAFDQIESTHKYLFQIKATEHDLGDKRYLHTIHQAAKTLN